MSVVMPEPPAESQAWVKNASKVKRLALPLTILVGATAISGAFVAGNDAVCNYYILFPNFRSMHILGLWGRDFCR